MLSMPAFSRYVSPEDHDLIRVMIRRINAATVINLGAAALIGVVALYASFWKALVLMMALRLGIATMSGAIGRNLARKMETGQPVVGALNALCLSFFVGGMSWAGILIVVPIELWNSIEAMTLTALIAVGVTVVAIIASPVPRAMWSFYGGFIIAMTFQLFTHMDVLGPLPWVWTGIALLTSGLAVVISRDIKRSVMTDVENKRMAETLGHLNEELGHALDRADRLARYDQLTGVRNRRAFEEEAGAIAIRRDRVEEWYAALVDLDHFKAINDKHGHHLGDEYLRRVGTILANVERRFEHAVSARLGGEEFVVLLPVSSEAEALAAAEAIRAEVELIRLDGGARILETTTSVGLSHWECKEPVHAALRRADQALYEAKSAGRNRVHLAGSADESAIRAA